MTISDLSIWRQQAADASGGTSADQIYSLIQRALQQYRLSGTVLDYGAGAGTFTQRLVSMCRFGKVYGADIMDKPSRLECVSWIKQDLNNPVRGYESYFDVVVAAEVIEHLENPRLVARELFRLCKPGGYLLLTTPNNESLRALISLVVRGHFVAFNDTCYPAHITALLRTDLCRLILEAGFRAPGFEFTEHGYVPGLTRWTWQAISGGLLRGVRFSDTVLAVAQKPASD